MYSWKERLADWWHRVTERWGITREVWVHILMSCGIIMVVVAIILGISIGGMKADIRQQSEQFAQDLAGIIGQQQAGYDQFQANMTEQLDDMGGEIQNDLQALIGAMQAELDQLQSDLGSLTAAYLTGEYGNYSVHVKALVGGNFTVNVHLQYSPGKGNSTDYAAALDYFYTSVNWTMGGVPSYVCSPTFNGTAWVITDVWFNIGSFALHPDGVSILPVACTGLNTTWVPDLAYVDVFRLSS